MPPVEERTRIGCLVRTVLPLLAAGALAAGLVACGGSGSGTTSTRAAASLPGSGKPPVTFGTQSVTEQVLIGQLYQQALEARGFTVALKQNIGSTQIADQALRSRQIDLYPAYVGVFETAVARDATRYASAEGTFTAGQDYARAHGFRLLPMTRFSTIDALVVLPDYARAHRLRAVGGLAAIRGLKLGAPPEFRRREAGLRGLARIYGIRDVDFAPLTVGLQYQALNDGQVDVADVLTTDGQLQSGRYVVLADPRHVFGFQNVTPVVSRRVLRAEGPAFAATLDAVSRALTTSAMQRMNAAVALNGKSPADVAQQFLQAVGLV
ncbi:MAG TPA: glycine betaine ABC transporter substrate-binding protein [Conexibacter sp.]|nr:glycine betaine ABC transporter substrate-binding protein [Conexibacter sp.]